jgi:hypothetical protein
MSLKRQYSYEFSAYEEIHVFHLVFGQPPGTAKGGRVSNDAVWVRGLTGIQLHHTTNLQDAGRFLRSAAMALRAAHVRTGDDRYCDLATQLKAVLVLARELEDEARAGLHRLHSTDPEQFLRWGAGAADVETVVVGGEILKAGGILVGPIAEHARELMHESRANLRDRTGQNAS